MERLGKSHSVHQRCSCGARGGGGAMCQDGLQGEGPCVEMACRGEGPYVEMAWSGRDLQQPCQWRYRNTCTIKGVRPLHVTVLVYMYVRRVCAGENMVYQTVLIGKTSVVINSTAHLPAHSFLFHDLHSF